MQAGNAIRFFRPVALALAGVLLTSVLVATPADAAPVMGKNSDELKNYHGRVDGGVVGVVGGAVGVAVPYTIGAPGAAGVDLGMGGNNWKVEGTLTETPAAIGANDLVAAGVEITHKTRPHPNTEPAGGADLHLGINLNGNQAVAGNEVFLKGNVGKWVESAAVQREHPNGDYDIARAKLTVWFLKQNGQILKYEYTVKANHNEAAIEDPDKNYHCTLFPRPGTPENSYGSASFLASVAAGDPVASVVLPFLDVYGIPLADLSSAAILSGPAGPAVASFDTANFEASADGQGFTYVGPDVIPSANPQGYWIEVVTTQGSLLGQCELASNASVGGAVGLLDMPDARTVEAGDSGVPVPYAAIAGVAATLVALATGGWYWRRRFSRN